MATTTAKIAALSKTDTTGITPELARKMYDSLGSHEMAIVEFKSAERTEGDDSSLSVKLAIHAIEPAIEDHIDEHLRELSRALYFKRNPQPALTTGDPSEPTVTAVLNATGDLVLNRAVCEHKYAEAGIAHARGTTDDYPPCIWRECGHIVTDRDLADTCCKTHPGDEDEAAA